MSAPRVPYEAQPFVNLLRGVLIQAVKDWADGIKFGSRPNSPPEVIHNYIDARNWFLSDDMRVFSFRYICEVCEIDYRKIRQKILANSREVVFAVRKGHIVPRDHARKDDA